MKLLIVDDEPLVQVGIQSMLDWTTMNIQICGTAKNGQEAYDIISKEHPEIVITDIKMPVMSGLDLLKKCREESELLPVFIMLTSFEEFQFAKQAIQYQASDYLIKLELNADVLRQSIEKAQQLVESYTQHSADTTVEDLQLATMRNRFYIRLLNNLFDEVNSYSQLKETCNISFTAPVYAAAHLKISRNHSDSIADMSLYDNTINMFKKLMDKYFKCTIITLDLKYCAAIFSLNTLDDYPLLKEAIIQVSSALHNYYNVSVYVGIGHFVEQPEQLYESYNDAKRISACLSDTNPIMHINEIQNIRCQHQNVFNLSIFKQDIMKAFENYDTDALHHITETILSLFQSDTLHYPQAVDVTSNILHFAVSMLPDGNELVSAIFKEHENTYLCLYECSDVSSILDYLTQLTDGLCNYFEKYKTNHKSHFIIEVKEYVDEHICEKLSLTNTALHFNISANYLSQLFKQQFKTGFNEYITHAKIECAKKLMRNGDVKIYEIAEQLGFENAFYFSKVFKKVTGQSPKEFLD